MWEFTNIGQYGSFLHTLTGLSSTGTYMEGIYSGISPTISFMYNNVLTNPYIIVLLLVLLVISLFSFSD